MKNIKWLMFDADNTLLDFSSAAEIALYKGLEEVGETCDPERYQIFQTINSGVWKLFEEGKMTALQLRSERFKRFFDHLQIAPMTPAAFSVLYLEKLVEHSEAYQGVVELLTAFKKRYKITMITNGLKEVQRPRLERLNLTHFFDSIIVSDEIHVAKPAAEFFQVAYDSLSIGVPFDEVLVVGDNVVADVGGGKDFGFKTCWISHGKENKTDIVPDLIVEKVLELGNVLA